MQEAKPFFGLPVICFVRRCVSRSAEIKLPYFVKSKLKDRSFSYMTILSNSYEVSPMEWMDPVFFKTNERFGFVAGRGCIRAGERRYKIGFGWLPAKCETFAPKVLRGLSWSQ
jgi:hypothetical protein